MVPLLPVTVIVMVPFLALLLTVTVSADVPLPPVMDDGLGVARVTPVLAPLVESATVPVKPFWGAMVTV